jgi:PIN domain nuclease of toxin-antitoxin system
VNLLLDTSVVLWWFMGDPKLPPRVRSAIADGQNVIMVSAASVWEISIKQALGKLRVPASLRQHLERDFLSLPISEEHAWVAGGLPSHHADPFDRMLIAQAKVEHLVLVSTDPCMPAYGVRLLPT